MNEPRLSSPVKTPAGAIWSLILGILSLFCLWILGSIPAIILGALALRKISHNPQEFGGRGIALAGIITGAVGIVTGLFTVAVVASLAMPAYNQIQDRAKIEHQSIPLRQVSLACMAYAVDHENKLPASLEELVPDYLPNKEDILWVDPESGTTSPLLYNSGQTIGSLGNKPLLLSPDSTARKRVVVFLDGSVQHPPNPIDPDILKHFE